MAENKKSFIAYSDWKDTFDALDDDKAGLLIKHIFSYVNDENPETDDPIVKAVFPNIKNTLKRDLKKWDKQYQQRVEAGKKSAEVRKRNATVVNARTVSSTVSVSDSVSDTNKETNTEIPLKTIFMVYVKEKMEEKGEADKYKRAGRSYMMSTYDAWKLNDWKDGNDKKIKNWKTKALMQLRYIK